MILLDGEGHHDAWHVHFFFVLVILKLPKVRLLSWTSHLCPIMTVALSKFRASFQSSMVEGLKNLDIEQFELLCLRIFERYTKCHEGISETLHTKADRAMAEIGNCK